MTYTATQIIMTRIATQMMMTHTAAEIMMMHISTQIVMKHTAEKEYKASWEKSGRYYAKPPERRGNG